MTVYTALFSNYEQLKEPTAKTPGWDYVCFTDQPFESETWEIVRMRPSCDPRRDARKVKALFHKFIDDPYSIWVDGSFLINCDLNEFWTRYFTAPFCAPVHPTRKCVYEEIRTVLSSRRGGGERIKEQEAHYRDVVPPNNGIITSGVLLRQNTVECRKLCEDWWSETEKWSLRDQVSFARVSMNNQNFHTFKWDYRFSKELIYVQHNHRSNKFVPVR